MARDLEASGGLPGEAQVRAMLESADEGRRASGILLRACLLHRAGRDEDALSELIASRTSLGCVPLPIMANIVWLSVRLGRLQRAAHECVAFGADCFRMSYWDLGLEACCAGLILDALGDYEIHKDPSKSLEVAAMYEQAAARLIKRSSPVNRAVVGTDRLNVAMIVPNLVDNVVAYTKCALYFGRHFDRSKYSLAVYVSENSSRRSAPMFPFGLAAGASEQSGRATLAELSRLGVPVVICRRDLRFTEAALDLAGRLEADGVDIAVFQTGLACPIDWIAARIARVPVKAAIHIGSSLFNRGLDATFFDNPANLEREAAFWTADMGRRMLLRQGTDIVDLGAQQAWPRSRFGIPDDATVVGCMSNHLDRRLSEPYMALIADALRANPKAWFLAFGSDTIEAKVQFFRERGVADRVRFGGRQTQSGRGLRVLDIYANEFPVGGSQSVVEAMACGVPVVAMKWSDAHAESAGALLVGPEYGVQRRDLDAYAALLGLWLRDPGARRKAGAAMRARAESCFSVRSYVSALLDECVRILEGKQRSGETGKSTDQ